MGAHQEAAMFFLLCALGLTPAHAAPDGPSWTLTVDPLTTALGFVHLQLEGRLADHWSVYAGPHARLFDGLLTEGHEPFVGLGAEAGLRWFPAGQAPEGWWLMTRGVAARAHTTDGSGQADLAGYGSVLGGFTGIIGGGLVLAGGLGVQYIDYTVGAYGTRGVLPAAHTNLGLAF